LTLSLPHLLLLLLLHLHAFPAFCVQAAQQHPYVVPPSAGRMGSWVGAACLGAVLGVCCINPDGGDYNVWLQQVCWVWGWFYAARTQNSLLCLLFPLTC
jgi:hypothetical protein